jgi:alpha-beta hydrolase superfamily lysophospholipase
MTHHFDRFPARDGLELYWQCWLPDEPTRGVVVVVHGINEHGGRYARLAEDLTPRGYAVYALDLRGHGRSQGDRTMVRVFDDYLDDVEVMLERVALRQPGQPLFLFGHSMGGAIAAWLAITRAPKIRGLILSAPAVLIAGGVFPVLRRLAALASRLWPSLRLTRMGCRFISRDPAVVEAFRNDPLVFHGRFPIRTGAEILRIAKCIQAEAHRITLPLLVLHGTGDFVTDPRGSRLLVHRAASTSKTLRLYAGFYHEVLSEPERDQVVADLVAWLNRLALPVQGIEAHR